MYLLYVLLFITTWKFEETETVLTVSLLRIFIFSFFYSFIFSVL